MNRATVLALDALRLQLEAHSDDINAGDKYVAPAYVPADEMPYWQRDTPLPDGFYELTSKLPSTPGSADIFIEQLKHVLGLGEHYLKEIREIHGRKGQYASVKKATAGAEQDYESAVKALSRSIREMKQTQASLRKVVDEMDAISKGGGGHTVYPKGKP